MCWNLEQHRLHNRFLVYYFESEYYILIGSRRIRVIQANMRMQIGVLHIIDKVIYDPNDPRTGQSITSSSSSVPSSLFLIVTSIQAFHLL